MKITFGVRRLGSSSSGEDRPRHIGAEDDSFSDMDKDKESRQQRDDLGEASAGVALRALAKALGISPAAVDTQRATKALRAFIATCNRDEEDDEDDSSEDDSSDSRDGY